jgi:hypothetical protein
VIIQDDFCVVHRIFPGKDGKAGTILLKPGSRDWRKAKVMAHRELKRRAYFAEQRLLHRLIQMPADAAVVRYPADLLARITVTLRPGAGKSGHYPWRAAPLQRLP